MLARDCPAVLVPGGQRVTLPQDMVVVVVQSLGGSFTVRSDRGHLARIAAVDADALGTEGLDPDAPAEAGSFSLEAVTEALKSVYDPEIPINVVDLGLIYECDARRLGDGTHRIDIKMSMTAPGCGMGDVLKEDARLRVGAVPGVSVVEVELVWDPPWDLSRLSEDARLELGMW
ncbi:MAG: putative Fe-S cluster assembly protein SufT [Acidimicrobiales bacterium]